MNQYSYAWEKLYKAVRTLTLGAGDMRSRLIDAYCSDCHTLRDDNFPGPLKKDWNWIEEQLTKKEPCILPDGRVYAGSVEETCRAMKNKTAVKIAKKILYLLDEINRLRDE